MNEEKDIKPFNKKGNPCGLWILYYKHGGLYIEGNYINGVTIGLWKWYEYSANNIHKVYYI